MRINVVRVRKKVCNFIASHLASPQPLSTSSTLGLHAGEGLNLALASGLLLSDGNFSPSPSGGFAAWIWRRGQGMRQGIDF